LSVLLRVTYFWILFWVSTVLAFSCLLLLSILGTLFRAGVSNIVHDVACVWAKSILVLTPGWTYEISGTENLPPKGQAVVVAANHQSAVDILAAYTLAFQFRWLSKASVFRLPFIGAAMRIAGYVPIERGNPVSHKEALCVHVLFSRRNEKFGR
jgi:1-acyl-sn-glycerol-3-phosphate acyltransferase